MPVYSQKPPLVPLLSANGLLILRQIFIGGLIVIGSIQLHMTTAILKPPLIYYKDILQEYLLVKALQANIDPYQPIPQLTNRFIGSVSVELLSHPTPHPPPVALFFFPMAWLSYEQSAILWYGLEIILLVKASSLLVTWAGKSYPLWKIILLALILVSWPPFMQDLLYGQLSIFILVLLLSAGIAWQHKRDIAGGIYIGLAVTLKLFTWPILIWLLLKRQWKSFASAVFVIIITNLAATIFMGWLAVLHYYTTISAQVIPYYRAFGMNYSISSIGWRVFSGTDSQLLIYFRSPPLIHAPALAPWFSGLLVAVTLIGCWLLAARYLPFDIGFAMMVTASIIVSPVAWIHYFVLLSIPATLLVTKKRHQLTMETIATLAVIWVFGDKNILMMIIQNTCALMGITPVNDVQPLIPFWIGAISFIPMIGVINIIRLLAKTGTNRQEVN